MEDSGTGSFHVWKSAVPSEYQTVGGTAEGYWCIPEKISKFHKSMVRRAGKGGEAFHIIPLVDFYNSIALSHIVPAGGFDIDQMQEGLSLRLSREGDWFMALDEEKEINVPAGEVSYADGNQIVTRQFVWKQAKHLLLNEHTKNVFFVSEILGDLPYETADNVAKALVNGLWKCFDISTAAHILDERNTHLAISE